MSLEKNNHPLPASRDNLHKLTISYMQLWNPSLQFIYSKLSVQKMEQTCGTYVHTAQLKNQSTFSWKWQQCHTDAGG